VVVVVVRGEVREPVEKGNCLKGGRFDT